MNLFPKEEKILASNGNKVLLTTHRIQMTDKDWGSYYTIEFFLENISSIEMRYRSMIIILVLGCFALFFGFYLYAENSSAYHSNNPSGIFFLAGFVLLAAWILTRQRIIRISSTGGESINMDVKQMSKEKIQEFIDSVQLAKSNRIDRLFMNV